MGHVGRNRAGFWTAEVVYNEYALDFWFKKARRSQINIYATTLLVIFTWCNSGFVIVYYLQILGGKGRHLRLVAERSLRCKRSRDRNLTLRYDLFFISGLKNWHSIELGKVKRLRGAELATLPHHAVAEFMCFSARHIPNAIIYIVWDTFTFTREYHLNN